MSLDLTTCFPQTTQSFLKMGDEHRKHLPEQITKILSSTNLNSMDSGTHYTSQETGTYLMHQDGSSPQVTLRVVTAYRNIFPQAPFDLSGQAATLFELAFQRGECIGGSINGFNTDSWIAKDSADRIAFVAKQLQEQLDRCADLKERVSNLQATITPATSQIPNTEQVEMARAIKAIVVSSIFSQH